MFGCVQNRVIRFDDTLRLVFLSVTAVLLLGCPVDAPANFSLEITRLVHVDPKGDSLNDADVVGGSNAEGPVILGPVVWANGQPLEIESNFEFGGVRGINNRGTVVGWEQTTGPDVQFQLEAIS